MDKSWFNVETSLFRVCEDGHFPLGCVAIERIVWEQSDKARLILYGHLPRSDCLLEIENGDGLDLIHYDCPPYDEYFPEDIIIHFLDCKIRRRWTPHAQVISDRHQGAIGVYVSLECDYRRGPGWTKTKSS